MIFFLELQTQSVVYRFTKEHRSQKTEWSTWLVPTFPFFDKILRKLRIINCLNGIFHALFDMVGPTLKFTWNFKSQLISRMLNLTFEKWCHIFFCKNMNMNWLMGEQRSWFDHCQTLVQWLLDIFDTLNLSVQISFRIDLNIKLMWKNYVEKCLMIVKVC